MKENLYILLKCGFFTLVDFDYAEKDITLFTERVKKV
jgi:hypothetical protein